MHMNDKIKNKFPITRRFQSNNEEKELLTVRCVECTEVPYFLEEGNPSRADLFNADIVTILRDLNREYNYWSFGIGHLFELYISTPDTDDLSFFRDSPIEIGFFVDEEVNLIVFAHRFLPDEWLITPFQWYAYGDFARAVPPAAPIEVNDRKFTVAIINQTGGKYLIVRRFILSLEFADKFHQAIQQQIGRGKPANLEEYRNKIETLYEYLFDNKVDSLLVARTLLEDELR